ENDVFIISPQYVANETSKGLTALDHDIEYIIEGLTVTSHETKNPMNHTLDMTFAANKKSYHITSNSQETVYQITRAPGEEPSVYSSSPELGLDFLSMMVHTMQFNGHDDINLSPMGLVRPDR